MAKEKSVRRCKVCGKVLQSPRLWYCNEHAESAHKEARKRAEKRSYQRRSWRLQRRRNRIVTLGQALSYSRRLLLRSLSERSTGPTRTI